nr:DUF429 domain-containing protein [Saprospiraceae bacterium]
MKNIWGVDFGARRSGNTVIAAAVDGSVVFYQVEKGADTDRWMEDLVEELKPELIAIDAPLSLPLGWCGGEGDLFYRECDEELKAMSPLFLGGLTGRAVKFARQLKSLKIKVIEAYPKGFVNHLLGGVHPQFTREIQQILDLLPKGVTLELEKKPTNDHQVDALMALVVAIRYEAGLANSFGKKEEGLIWV